MVRGGRAASTSEWGRATPNLQGPHLVMDVGVAHATLHADDLPPGVRAGAILRPAIGVGGGIRLARRTAVEVQLRAVGRGGRSIEGPGAGFYQESMRLDYLAIRITGAFDLRPAARRRNGTGGGSLLARGPRIYFEVGPEIGWLRSAKREWKGPLGSGSADASPLFRRVDAAGRIGLGAGFPTGAGEIYGALGFSLGLSNLNGTRNRNEVAVRTRAVEASTGIRLR